MNQISRKNEVARGTQYYPRKINTKKPSITQKPQFKSTAIATPQDGIPSQAQANFGFDTPPKQKPTDKDNRTKKPSRPRKLKIEPPYHLRTTVPP